MEIQEYPVPPGNSKIPVSDHSGSPEPIRRDTYALLSALLRDWPSEGLLKTIIMLDPESAPREMRESWRGLIRAAEQCPVSRITDEYHSLFIGLGCGEIIPYASAYVDGLLMSRPLAAIRRDLSLLGLGRQPGVSEPEDHAAALCETMAIMNGSFHVDESRQAKFFRTHMEPWMIRFFRDIQKARSADFYRAVGCLGERFFESEQNYFYCMTEN